MRPTQRRCAETRSAHTDPMTVNRRSMNNHSRLSQTAIWDTADKYLRSVVPRQEYGDYIIPFLVLRRLECILADTKTQVIEYLRNEASSVPHGTAAWIGDI